MKKGKTLKNIEGQYLVWNDCHGAVPANTTSGIIYERSGSYEFSWVDEVTENMGILLDDGTYKPGYFLRHWKNGTDSKFPKELDNDAIHFLEKDREVKGLDSKDYKIVSVVIGE